jgi:hypothetical protein
MLSLSPYIWKGEGPNLSHNRKAIGFEVTGLPANEKVLIAELYYGWQILRIVDGTSDNWSGCFTSPEEALRDVQFVGASCQTAV